MTTSNLFCIVIMHQSIETSAPRLPEHSGDLTRPKKKPGYNALLTAPRWAVDLTKCQRNRGRGAVIQHERENIVSVFKKRPQRKERFVRFQFIDIGFIFLTIHGQFFSIFIGKHFYFLDS